MPTYLCLLPAAALLIAFAIPASAQVPRDPGAAANVRESQLYDQMLRSSPSFRAKRMQLECGPISDPQLHATCVASFEAYGPIPSSRQRQQ